jgi:hypothetical protein
MRIVFVPDDELQSNPRSECENPRLRRSEYRSRQETESSSDVCRPKGSPSARRACLRAAAGAIGETEEAMANRSYLCGTSLETTYPSFVDKHYDSNEQTIACDVWCVPLLWHALFRSNDIARKVFHSGGEAIATEAPLVARTTAIEQLQAALPYFNRLFAAEGALDEYARFLREALESVEYTYVTIELQEIACLTSPEQAYYDKLRATLGGIGHDYSDKAKAQLIEFAQFHSLRRFPPARLLLDKMPASDEDIWNHCRMCGAGAQVAGIGRSVPWEG